MPAPDDGGIWGVLGGAYDPFHYGHLMLAEEIRDAKRLTGVLFVPAYNHPFKNDTARATYTQRVAMTRLGLQTSPNLLVNEIEAEENLPGYTIDTIKALKKRFPRSVFRFIIGADNLEQIKDWHRPQELLQEVNILAGARPGYELKPLKGPPSSSIELVEVNTPDISSTRLRRELREGTPCEKLLEFIPQAVCDYIRKEKLYQ